MCLQESTKRLGKNLIFVSEPSFFYESSGPLKKPFRHLGLNGLHMSLNPLIIILTVCDKVPQILNSLVQKLITILDRRPISKWGLKIKGERIKGKGAVSSQRSAIKKPEFRGQEKGARIKVKG